MVAPSGGCLFNARLGSSLECGALQTLCLANKATTYVFAVSHQKQRRYDRRGAQQLFVSPERANTASGGQKTRGFVVPELLTPGSKHGGDSSSFPRAPLRCDRFGTKGLAPKLRRGVPPKTFRRWRRCKNSTKNSARPPGGPKTRGDVPTVGPPGK